MIRTPICRLLDIPPAAQIIARIEQEAEEILSRRLPRLIADVH